MMTLTQVERLVRKVAEVAGQPPSDTQTAKLAQDYAEACRAANRRLEQCAIMIEAGQFLQALQLAETPPPLLDLITLLSFRQASEWRNYCHAHQLPWTEPFYDKYIRLLNDAYGKGIAGDHPFYRDYRRAVMENDDPRALSILRVIARLNPSDVNTKEELKRVEDKLLRARLESLRQVLAAGDSTAAQASLEQLEASGLPVPSSHPVWQQAQVARCQQLLARAAQLRQQDLWQDAETLVEDIHAFATRYNVRLPNADADAWNSLEEWVTQKRAACAAEQDFQRAVSALEYEVESLATRRAVAARLSVADATASFNSLAGKWRESERFGHPLAEDLVGRCQDCSDWLQKQIRAANRRKRVVTFVLALVVLAALAASVPFVLGLFRARDYAQRFAQLETARKVSDTESLLAEVQDRAKGNPQFAPVVSKAKDFIAREKGLKQDFDQKFGGLQHLTGAGFQGAEAQAGPARADCERAAAKLAPEFQPAASSTLAAWDAQWQSFRNKELAALLGGAEREAAALNATNGVEAVKAAIPRVQSALRGVEVFETQPPPLDAALADRLGRLNNKIEVCASMAGKWEQGGAALTNAQSLEQYLQALDQWMQSPFATPAQKDAAGKIHRLNITLAALLGQLLLPNDPSDWDTLTNVAVWSASLMPEQPTGQEKDVYFKLRDDKNLRDVHAYQLETNARAGNPHRSHTIFVQGLMAPNKVGDQAGMVHDPTLYTNTLHFERTPYDTWDYVKVTYKHTTLESDSYTNLQLGGLIDANTGNYQKPILQYFDQLNRATNASSMFRAFVTLKLLAVADLRPKEWGFQWCPAAAAHIKALKELGAGDINSGDWMVLAQHDKFEVALQRYFEDARKIPLEKQATFLRQLARETCEKGFVFAGFIDADGRPVLRQLDSPATELCGWNNRSTAIILLRKTLGTQTWALLDEPLPFTPLLAFAGDRRQLLQQTLAATGYTDVLARPVLPPFYSSLYE